MKSKFLLAAAAASLLASPVQAQTRSVGDRLGSILGTIFGSPTTADASLDAQWRAGRMPLAAQRSQFEARVDADVRSGQMTSSNGSQLKYDYAAIVDLEARYGSDGQFSTAERSELSQRYSALTQALGNGTSNNGGYVYNPGTTNQDTYGQDTYGQTGRAEVREGQVEFNRRVDAAVSARRITRTTATRIKNDYAATVRLEANYLRNGTLSSSERADIDSRLDALDQRVGDVGYNSSTTLTTRTRLDNVLRAVPSSGLSIAAQTQLRVEQGDLLRLDAAYKRFTPTSEERSYLERRIAELELRARVSRY